MKQKLIEKMARLSFDMTVQQLEILEFLVGEDFKNVLVNILIKYVQGVK